MAETYNIYCDESCHLEHDSIPVMVLGACWCSAAQVRRLATRIREIKQQHGLAYDFEIKWVKVSPAKLSFYSELIDLFFDDESLHFRALIVPDKAKLRHGDFEQDHDLWYYKMMFNMLKAILASKDAFNIYLDIKDTRSADRVHKLEEVLRNAAFGINFDPNIISRVQTVRSNEVPLLQLADLLIGAVSYANRGLSTSPAKAALVRRIEDRSGFSLCKTTLLREMKVNLFVWQPQEVVGE